MSSPLLLAAASFLAGAMNAVAGGGSFVTFPALVWSGVPSVAANASSSVALFPGSFASAWAYRDDFRSFEGVSVRALLPVSLAGGLTGAMLLLLTPQTTFDAVIPWLLLLGTLAFAFGQQAGARLRQRIRIGPALLLGGQFVLSIYGGYFGGAVGLMMMAVWSLFGVSDLRAMNAAKTLLVGVTNTVAVACFIVAGEVWWTQTLLMALGAVAGGYVGARVGRRISPSHLRLGITAFNVAMTAAFFLRT
ncbi:sulfite exporter TauE/SafE family protein [Archangium lansingense]|uniref:Probable membrane transporter protein n=1 Tax=Archangium lansingense TaxID=2995310 RepID=A0ABT4AK86_9BACT|nr:sulfite exporter TauE/SafE family protein [Archangium lansinium]MCY1081574.1 sulfite exporter TauE/SafE family protein [Archangium lansinium]